MSRIGKLPIKLPEGVEVDIRAENLLVKGPKGQLEKKIPQGLVVEKKDGSVLVSLKKENSALSSIYGTTRAIIANIVHGVTEGWSKSLELVGTGYRAEVVDNNLVLTVGHSHPVKINAPEGIAFKVEKTDITVEGIDKELVGQVAANIRAVRPPEPYKGKGIRYKDEFVRRKPGKAAKAQGVGAA
jgi:large subunit ribosomal protein L6